MNSKQINCSAEILAAYVEKYPETDLVELFVITAYINDEVCKANGKLYIDEIVERVHKRVNNTFSLYSIFNPDKEVPTEKHCNHGNSNCACSGIKTREKKAKYSVNDNKDSKLIKVLLPGVDRKDVVLSYDNNVLTIKLNDDIILSTSFISHDLKMEFSIEEDCDIDKMNATLEQGVLTIEIPKKEKINTARIFEIK